MIFGLALALLGATRVSSSIPRACSTPETSKFPFCDASLSLDARLDDLISRIDTKYVPELLTARASPHNAIPELGLPEYNWGANCIHGVQSKCGTHCPTSFPSPNALGATFNRPAFRKMGQIIAQELRALWLEGVEENGSPGRPHIGLDCWSPNINLNRDPRWGRNQEVVSEDPLLSAAFGVEYTRGLQEGEDPRYLKGISTLKHWDAYSLENIGTSISRHNFNAVVSKFDLADSYFKAFKASVVEGKAKGVMCSYNAVNGVPSCANEYLNSVLREKWGFTGYVTSDTGAVADIYKHHKYTSTAENATALALAAGTDIDSGNVYKDALINGLNEGIVKKDDMVNALRNSLRMRFELGLFDPIEDQPYWNVSPDVVNTPESQEFNLNITRQGIVLLKNDHGLLPLKKGSSIAVIGPHFNATGDLVGNYIGQICPKLGDSSCIQSPLQAITASNTGGKVTYAQGCSVSGTSTSGFNAALSVAGEADVIVMMLGLDQTVERESHDRTSITLPGVQSQLFSKVIALNKPVVVVLIHGGAIAIEEIIASPAAIVDSFYSGYKGSQAIADVLFGDYNPSGKLPVTVYPRDFVNAVDYKSMSMTEGDGRSYRYYKKQPLFEFGFGLSYTTFLVELGGTKVIVPGQPLEVEVRVTNTGDRTGSEVVLVFFSPVQLTGGFKTDLKKQLIDFIRVEDLAPGEVALPQVSVDPSQLTLVNSDGDEVLVPGTYDIIFSNGLTSFTVQYLIPGPSPVVVDRF